MFMKKVISIIVLGLLVNTGIIVGVSGCKLPPSQQKIAVNTLSTVHQTVDVALDGYLDLVIKGQLSTNNVPVVLNAYGRFQQAYNAGLLVVANNTNAVAPQDVITAADAFNSVLSLAKKGGL